ncbi:MAG: heavy metal translocating P-type ATPase [Candidatus Thorarchaeota archaeon]|jgi:Cd2+/Zn2+-exporting ATPase
MSAELETACAYCAAEAAMEEDVSFRTKYIIGIVSLISLVAGVMMELLAFDAIIFYTLFAITLVSAGRWIIPSGLRGAAKLHLDINFLMTSAAFGAFVIGAPAEGAMALFLFYVAELLEEKAGSRVRGEVQSLLELKPTLVDIKTEDGEVQVRAEEAHVDEIMIVRPGSAIGLDGIVVRGESSVDQSSITGESVPVPKSVGDDVFAGTVNHDGYLEVRTTKECDETLLSRIIAYVEESRTKKSNTEKYVSRFSHVYTPVVVAIAIAVVVVTLFLGFTPRDSVYRGLTLLVISCPCAFAISIPVSMVSAVTGMARTGVLVKGSTYIEKMSRVSVVAFDKTGTITEGCLVFKELILAEPSLENDILTALGSLEHMSEHPVALAISSEMRNRGIVLIEVQAFMTIPGKGVKGTIAGVDYIVGTEALLGESNVSLIESHLESGLEGTRAFIARNGVHVATVVLTDAIRIESEKTVSELRDRGIQTIMLTGDNEVTAEKVASSVGFDRYYSQLLPEEKAKVIEELAVEHVVAMVGDGVNDAPGLAAADVGIAMAVTSSDVALETADVALMDDDLSRIPTMQMRARKTMGVVRQNVAASISIKLFLGALAVFGFVPLWVGVALGDMGLSLAVIGNALRLAAK